MQMYQSDKSGMVFPQPCYRMFRSNFAYLFILILSSHPSMQNRGEGLPSIICAGHGLFVKMLINLEPHGIF